MPPRSSHLPHSLRVLRPALASFLLLSSWAAAPALADGVTITGGLGHTCTLTMDGAVLCWGLNDAGQLGDGTLTDRPAPGPVPALAGMPIVALDSGEAFTCAQTSTGELYCWGENTNGQLGNGTTVSASSPVPVAGLGGPIESFSAGNDHVCALLTNGTAQCWGANSSAQLGDGTIVSRTVPTAVAGFPASLLLQSVTAGQDHTCAVTQAGDAYCWGGNFYGQLGDGTSRTRTLPVRVVGLSTRGQPRLGFVAQMVAGSHHTCALSTGGSLFCWGNNASGQLGNSLLQSQRLPSDVAGIDGAIDTLDAGDAFTCARTTLDALWCWGANTDGQLGIDHLFDRSIPTPVSRLGNAALSFGLGLYHACAGTNSALLYCWGDNFYGQLGDLTTDSSAAPIPTEVFTLVDLSASQAVPVSLPARMLLGVALAGFGGWLAHRAGRPRGSTAPPR